MSEQLLLGLLEASARATLLAALVAALLGLLRIPRGAPRHTAWLIVVSAMAMMPALQQFSPALPAVSPKVPDMAELMTLASIEPRSSSSTTAVAVPTEQTSAAGAGMFSPLTAAQAEPSPTRWPVAAACVYVTIAGVLLFRLLLALYGVRRILRRARPVGDGAYESNAIVTPVTIGVLRSRVVLPMTWREWPEETRRAVLAHERAHVTRRDPLVALLARLNRCIFWFHPLSWWLEQTLADCAEDACDETALQTAAEPRQYAEVLLAMAKASRQHRGRLAWTGAPVAAGRLHRRIDRILQGRQRATSRARTWIAATGCAISVVVVVACQSRREVQPLAPPEMPPEMAQRREANRREAERRQGVWDSARAMTWAQVAELEAVWRRNREDLATLEKLLFFYSPDISGKHSPDDAKKIAGRRPLILWLIEHHPDFEFHRELHARIFGRTDWLMDPAGYDAAKKLWLAHAAKPNVSPETLRNAASFLDVEDKPIAERLLLQGRRLNGDAIWSERLGRLYAAAVVGSDRFMLGNVVSSRDPAVARGAYAARAKAALDASTDPALLANAASYLLGIRANDIDGRELARTYLDRAVELDPKSERARSLLDLMDGFAYVQNESELFANVPRESRRDVIAKLPEPERLLTLIRQANSEYVNGWSHDWQAKSPQSANEARPERVEEHRRQARAAWQRSKTYAQDALDLAKRLPNHPYHGDAVFSATVALGTNAFREGDQQSAVRYMLEAAQAPPSTTTRRTSRIFGIPLETRLIGGLLQYGERETVIQYFERSAEKRPTDRERLRAAATAIRNGKLPVNYERR